MKKTGKRLRRAAALLLSLCLSAGLLTTAALALDTPAAPTNLRFEIEPHDPKQEKFLPMPFLLKIRPSGLMDIYVDKVYYSGSLLLEGEYRFLKDN